MKQFRKIHRACAIDGMESHACDFVCNVCMERFQYELPVSAGVSHQPTRQSYLGFHSCLTLSHKFLCRCLTSAISGTIPVSCRRHASSILVKVISVASIAMIRKDCVFQVQPKMRLLALFHVIRPLTNLLAYYHPPHSYPASNMIDSPRSSKLHPTPVCP